MDLVSQCALRVANVVWRPGHGGFAFTVVCKATFELRPDVSPLAAEQEPVALVDVYADEGGGLAVASDLVPVKKRPEVLHRACVCAGGTARALGPGAARGGRDRQDDSGGG